MTDNERQWFIYVLKDPRTDEVRYVGYTGNPSNRLRGHIHDGKTPMNHKSCWINSLLKIGLVPTIESIETGYGDSWQEAEIRWITYHKSIGTRLTNSVDGGMGGSNPSAETRQRISNARIGKPLPESQRRNIALAAIGRVQSEYTKKKRADKIRGMKRSDETKRRTSLASKGRKWSNESVLRKSLSRVLRCEDGEIFYSLKAAARSVDKNHNSIKWAIISGTECAGYHWSFMDKQVDKIITSGPRRVKARNIETGEIFESINAAARKVGVARDALTNAMSNGRTCAGYHWERVENG